MDEEKNNEVEDSKSNTQQLIVVVAGAAATFAIKKLVEKGVEAAFEWNRTRKTTDSE